LKIRGLHKENL